MNWEELSSLDIGKLTDSEIDVLIKKIKKEQEDYEASLSEQELKDYKNSVNRIVDEFCKIDLLNQTNI